MVNIGSFGAAKAEVEGETHTFEFYGETFEVSSSVGIMPLLAFAHAAQSGMDASEAEGLAAMYDMLRDCLKPDEYREMTQDELNVWKAANGDSGRTPPKILVHSEWNRFQEVAKKNRVDGDTLLEVCRAVYSVLTGKASRPPQDTSGGPSKTSKS